MFFYDADQFGFSAPLREHWREILREYREVRGELTAWPEAELYDGRWSAFQLFAFPHGERIEAKDDALLLVERPL